MVDELKKLNFKILGVITNNYIIPNYEGVPLETLVTYKLDETKKITLLDIVDTNNLSTKNNSKLQLAKSINNNTIILYDFSKGLNNREINYFTRLLIKISSSYNKKIILISKDINFLMKLCDLYCVYDKRIVYSTDNIFDDKLYSYVDMPNIVKFIKLANKKGAMLNNNTDINELLKDIYRRINANKDCI